MEKASLFNKANVFSRKDRQKKARETPYILYKFSSYSLIIFENPSWINIFLSYTT